MLKSTLTRSMTGALLATALTSYLGMHQVARLEICLREMLRPVHTECDLEGRDRDPHLDRRICHELPILFLELNRELAPPCGSVSAWAPEPPRRSWASTAHHGWSEPPLETFGARAPPLA